MRVGRSCAAELLVRGVSQQFKNRLRFTVPEYDMFRASPDGQVEDTESIKSLPIRYAIRVLYLVPGDVPDVQTCRTRVP
jgi:hypothetical protein